MIAVRLGTSLQVAEAFRRSPRPDQAISALGISIASGDGDRNGAQSVIPPLVAACSHWRITATTALNTGRDSSAVTVTIASANRRAAVLGMEYQSP